MLLITANRVHSVIAEGSLWWSCKKSECVTPNEERGLSTDRETRISRFAQNDKKRDLGFFMNTSIMIIEGGGENSSSVAIRANPWR